jgi:hypothetical protein
MSHRPLDLHADLWPGYRATHGRGLEQIDGPQYAEPTFFLEIRHLWRLQSRLLEIRQLAVLGHEPKPPPLPVLPHPPSFGQVARVRRRPQVFNRLAPRPLLNRH